MSVTEHDPGAMGGAGKRLFEGFDHDLDLEVRRVYASCATHVRYAVKR